MRLVINLKIRHVIYHNIRLELNEEVEVKQYLTPHVNKPL